MIPLRDRIKSKARAIGTILTGRGTVLWNACIDNGTLTVYKGDGPLTVHQTTINTQKIPGGVAIEVWNMPDYDISHNHFWTSGRCPVVYHGPDATP